MNMLRIMFVVSTCNSHAVKINLGEQKCLVQAQKCNKSPLGCVFFHCPVTVSREGASKQIIGRPKV